MAPTLNRIRVDYDDNDVRQRVSSFLNSRHIATLRLLNVDVQNGSCTVSGNVSSFYEKQVALNSCRRVAGVLSLVDALDVQSDSQVSICDGMSLCDEDDGNELSHLQEAFREIKPK